MAEETTVGDEFIESTDTQVGIIGDNMADTAGEVGDLIRESILSKLNGVGVTSVEPPPPPDVSAAQPLAGAHSAIKEAAATTAPPTSVDTTTMHDQLEQARLQMAQLGK